MGEEIIRILSRVSGLEKHEYTKNMENLDMSQFDFLKGVEPDIFQNILTTCSSKCIKNFK